MVQKAFKYRFYPTPEQAFLLRRTLGCVRLVYNKALAARTEAWYQNQERINYTATSKMLTAWKKEEDLSFLKEVSSVPLQQCLRHLQEAFGNFWAKRTAYPNFKKKRNGCSAAFTKAGFSVVDGEVYIAKSKEPLAIRWSRQLPKGIEPSSAVIKLSPAGRWSISLLCDVEIAELPVVTKEVGVDLGLTHLAIMSDGEKVANPRNFNKKFKRLRKAQKSLSRKVRGSNNRYKAKRLVAKIHAEIADARKDHLHKLTTRLVRENQVIAVESLAVKNMVKNRKLARSINDAAWGELVRQLRYKCEWYGRFFVEIDQWFPSSKLCSACHQKLNRLPLNVREWKCPSCNTNHDRDINAAINILAAGKAVLVCGATVRPTTQLA